MPNRREFLGAMGAGIAGGFLFGGTPEEVPRPKVPEGAILDERERALILRWDAPTIANALERTKARPATEGFMGPAIKPRIPDLGPLLGYAVTATIQASRPAESGKYVDRFEYYEYIQSLPAPRVMVIHDLDAPKPVGSFWGEVHGSLHRALGCIGVITDGGVRDLGPVGALRFHLFAAEVIVSHAHVHLVDFGKPVVVGGLEVKPGDLLFGDEHGVIDIPHDLAKKTAGLCYEVYQAERPSIDFYHSPDFSLEKLRERQNAKKKSG